MVVFYTSRKLAAMRSSSATSASMGNSVGYGVSGRREEGWRHFTGDLVVLLIGVLVPHFEVEVLAHLMGAHVSACQCMSVHLL